MIRKNERCRYASDLSNSQWAIIKPLFPPAGNRSKWEKRELVDAVLYSFLSILTLSGALTIINAVVKWLGKEPVKWALKLGKKIFILIYILMMINLTLLYKITLDDKDAKLLAKSLRKNKEFLESVQIAKKDFTVEDIGLVKRALNHRYKFGAY